MGMSIMPQPLRWSRDWSRDPAYGAQSSGSHESSPWQQGLLKETKSIRELMCSFIVGTSTLSHVWVM